MEKSEHDPGSKGKSAWDTKAKLRAKPALYAELTDHTMSRPTRIGPAKGETSSSTLNCLTFVG